MTGIKSFDATVDARGRGAIEVDGADLSFTVAGFRLAAGVGSIPQLTLDVPLRHGGRVSGQAAVVVDDATATLLKSLGWTPPDGAA